MRLCDKTEQLLFISIVRSLFWPLSVVRSQEGNELRVI